MTSPETPPVPHDHTDATTVRGPAATPASYALMALGPLLAWALWISWSDGDASDQVSVAWFVTVALTCVVAAALAPPRVLHGAALSMLGILSTLTTLTWWWSGEEEANLFLVGVIVATPFVAVAAPLLVLLGMRSRWR